MTKHRNPLRARSDALKLLLDVMRAAGYNGHAEYGWQPRTPQEPRVVIEDVPVHAETTVNGTTFVVDGDGGRRYPVNDLARVIEAVRCRAEIHAHTRKQEGA